MGGTAASKVPCTIADSPGGSGLKSIVSAPLDEFVSPDKFWELYEKQVRLGFGESAMGKTLGVTIASHETKDIGDGWFKVTDVVAGPPETTVLVMHKFDKEKREWNTKMFNTKYEESDVREKVTIQELSSPFRIEGWMDAKGQRLATAAEAGILKFILPQVLKRLGVEAMPEMKTDVEGSDGKPVVLTEALDASIEPDKFWAQWVGLIKDGIGKAGVVEHTMTEVDATSFMVVDKFDGGYVHYEKFIFDPAKDLFQGDTYEMDESMPETCHRETWVMKLLRDPMRVEWHKEVKAGRKTLSEFLGIMQGCIDSVIAEAESGGSWFG